MRLIDAGIKLVEGVGRKVLVHLVPIHIVITIIIVSDVVSA